MPGNRPPFRKLKGYAFDPSTSLNLSTADINEIVYKIPWEVQLLPGPEGDYIKVIDRDPASNAVYKPVDLNEPSILASDGLTPSETNPQFHQQMVYAVVMNTIKNFEMALGRKVMWSNVQKFRKEKNGRKGKMYTEFVEKLLVYPHAVREQNAYYSPDRKALLFGYYNATPAKGGTFLPGGIVYSCLSHDIIAHETTHAILDGMYPRYMETSHPDMAGFHEGFADIIALLQHFTYPEIVKNEIRQTQGKLHAESMLGKLAVEFGQSTGEYHSLRDAIGTTDANGTWIPKVPSTADYETMIECHDRGALLVSAVFDAFVAIYKNRTADLLRIATGGTGVMPAGDIHPDLVGRLADEASKAASHVLCMCVRALDYCPPVDLNYGDYLRALITADKELVLNDDHHYRIAFINAFRKRGIFPEGVPNLSVDTLCYNVLPETADKTGFMKQISDYLRKFKEQLAYKTDRRQIFDITQDFITGNDEEDQPGFYRYLFGQKVFWKNPKLFENITGLVFSSSFKKLGIGHSRMNRQDGAAIDVPSIELHSLKMHNRTGPDGQVQNQIIMTLMQRCTVMVKDAPGDKKLYVPYTKSKTNDELDRFTFRGGCTLIFDLNDLMLKHAICKPIFDPAMKTTRGRRVLAYHPWRIAMQYRCMLGDYAEKIGFAPPGSTEPFAAIHEPQNAVL
ncbi:MAG: hypothetical protein JNJ86_16960 [Chitinophagaceae bacterium]|nr:hypothetical protein [Chitinophagaceae bacterium]